MIQSGKKTVEGRIATPKYRSFSTGDTLTFKTTGIDVLSTKIMELKCFTSFENMLSYFGVQACLPGLVTIEEAVKVYRSLPGYKEKESQFGVIGIRIYLF